MKFFLGIIAGALLFGSFFFYREQRASHTCGGYCGAGTVCRDNACQSISTEEPQRPRATKSARRRNVAEKSELGPEQKIPTAADYQPSTQGPSLDKAEQIDMEDDGARLDELPVETVTRAMRRVDDQILECLDRARGDYTIEKGTVTIAFRVERTGSVKQVRITAPSLLQRQGLYPCIQAIITAFRFPESGRAQVMTYPYRLR